RPGEVSTPSPRPCPSRRATTQERLCQGLSLRLEQPGARRFGDETRGLEVQWRSGPRLSAASPARSRLLASSLEALGQGPPPRCRKHHSASIPPRSRSRGPPRRATFVGDSSRRLLQWQRLLTSSPTVAGTPYVVSYSGRDSLRRLLQPQGLLTSSPTTPAPPGPPFAPLFAPFVPFQWSLV